MPAVLFGEASGRDAANAAMGPHLVVIAPPIGNDFPSLVQRLEPVLVQALVAEFPIEALDVAVLHRLARLDQQVTHAVLDGPGNEGSARELRPVVCPDCGGIASEPGCPVEQPRDVLARDAVVHRDVDAFVAEVVGYRQALQTATIGQAVAD